MPAEAEPSVQKDESIVNIPTSHDISCDEILVNNCDFLIWSKYRESKSKYQFQFLGKSNQNSMSYKRFHA